MARVPPLRAASTPLGIPAIPLLPQVKVASSAPSRASSSPPLSPHRIERSESSPTSRPSLSGARTPSRAHARRGSASREPSGRRSVRRASRPPSASAGAERIIAGVRLRPWLPRERQLDSWNTPRGLASCVRIEAPNRVYIVDPQTVDARAFEYDFVLDSSSSTSEHYADQEAVYRKVGAPLAEQAISGFNGCVCAYGQTGTGKTFTISGDWRPLSPDRGLLPRLIEDLVARLNTGYGGRMFASFIEVYNDQLIDLLAEKKGVGADDEAVPKSRHGRLDIHTHPALGVYVENLTEIEVQTVEEVRALAAAGNNSRHTARTEMNDRSSRSHTIFSLRMDIWNPEGDKAATLQVADLAGRENEQKTEVKGERLRELTFINRSLFQLANCISALSRNDEHVPFRNSRLTLLLSESFRRNSRTCLLATLTPSSDGLDDNLLTCRFLESARKIRTAPVANELGLVLAAREELKRLRGASEVEERPRRGLEESEDRAHDLLAAAARIGERLELAEQALGALEADQSDIDAAMNRIGSRMNQISEAVHVARCPEKVSLPPIERHVTKPDQNRAQSVTFSVSLPPLITLL